MKCFCLLLLVGLCHIQPSAYNNVATYSLGKSVVLLLTLKPRKIKHILPCSTRGLRFNNPCLCHTAGSVQDTGVLTLSTKPVENYIVIRIIVQACT